jgi:sulfite reductase (NADPH) flavoprotein alpha-component
MTWGGVDVLRQWAAAGLVLLYLGMCLLIAQGQWRRRRRAARDAASLAPVTARQAPLLVAYASQTGSAEELAWQTARSLHTAGVAARIVPLSELGEDDLSQAERVLFIVSTYGEGDPPDNAALFAGQLMGRGLSLPNLHHGMLALGDSNYVQFCGFGRALDEWLLQCGAMRLFDRVEMDNGDEAALREWRRQLSHIVGTLDMPDWQAPPYEPWRLVTRQHLNPGSAGGPTYHLELVPAAHGEGTAPMPHWEAGDLVQVLAPADPDRPREYSIASIPSDGRLHLLVRQERHGDGQLGVASGWLTAQADVMSDEVALRLRPHRNFRLNGNAGRPLILIGNGTGLAGLRGHLKARAATWAVGAQRNWLVFGERQAAFDFYYRDEIQAWLGQGVLERADIVFSRDSPARCYVQDRLRGSAQAVRDWVADGAAIYVCGSLEGMAGGVEAALVEVLGAESVERLTAEGRYRRDVY